MTITIKNQRILPQNKKLADKTESSLDELEAVSKSWVVSGALADATQGYTYLGQFIAHDIAPRPGVNSRSWKLDLDSVYPDFFDFSKIEPNSGKFRYTPKEAKFTSDLERDPQTRKANIPEFRNDDQMIIAQMHLAIQLFHNEVIDVILNSTLGSLSRDSLYVIAREYVRACFQHIVMEDFLKEICNTTVYEALWKNSRPEVLSIRDSELGIPFEISHAVGRFGHSLVRENYTLNPNYDEAKGVPLRRLFELSGENNSTFDGIPKELEIDWTMFFDRQSSRRAEHAKRFDPVIVDAMLQAPNPNIIQMNLKAGIRKKVTSGQILAKRIIQVLQELNIDPANPDKPLGICDQLSVTSYNEAQKKKLEKLGFWKSTPLWLFILIEADSPNNYGLRLGPLGSLLIIETMKNAIRIPGAKDFDKVRDALEAKIPQLGQLHVETMLDLTN